MHDIDRLAPEDGYSEFRSRKLCLSRNVGSYEGALRFVAGMVLLACANHGYTWGWLGLPLIGCAAIGFCPIWYVFAIDSTRWDAVSAPARRTRRRS